MKMKIKVKFIVNNLDRRPADKVQGTTFQSTTHGISIPTDNY